MRPQDSWSGICEGFLSLRIRLAGISPHVLKLWTYKPVLHVYYIPQPNPSMSDPHDTIFPNNGDGELEGTHDSSSDDDAMLTDDDHGSGSSIEEVADEDIANYFLEIDSRLYPSHPTAPYPLPVDTPENDVSRLLRLL